MIHQKMCTKCKVTNKLRELTSEEATLFKLRNDSGYNMYGKPDNWIPTPVWEGIGEVWATAVTENTRTYRIYYCGTNNLKIIVYKPAQDTWEMTELMSISSKDLHTIFHSLICEIQNISKGSRINE